MVGLVRHSGLNPFDLTQSHQVLATPTRSRATRSRSGSTTRTGRGGTTCRSRSRWAAGPATSASRPASRSPGSSGSPDPQSGLDDRVDHLDEERHEVRVELAAGLAQDLRGVPIRPGAQGDTGGRGPSRRRRRRARRCGHRSGSPCRGAGPGSRSRPSARGGGGRSPRSRASSGTTGRCSRRSPDGGASPRTPRRSAGRA